MAKLVNKGKRVNKKVNRKGEDGQTVKFVRHSAGSKFIYVENQIKHIDKRELEIVQELTDVLTEEKIKELKNAS